MFVLVTLSLLSPFGASTLLARLQCTGLNPHQGHFVLPLKCWFFLCVYFSVLYLLHILCFCVDEKYTNKHCAADFCISTMMQLVLLRMRKFKLSCMKKRCKHLFTADSPSNWEIVEGTTKLYLSLGVHCGLYTKLGHYLAIV